MTWRSRHLTQYLRHFEGDRHTIARLRQVLQNHRVYGWHLANLLKCLSDIAQPDDIYPICQEWLLDTRLPWYQRLAAAEALSRIRESAAFCDICSENEQNTLVRRALFASSYMLAGDDLASQKGLIRRILQDEDEEIKRTGIYFLLSHSELSWDDFADMERQIESLRVLIPDLTPEGECFIARTLSDFFQADDALDINFEDILDGDYDAARRHLQLAIGAHDTSPSRYVCRMDNFNIMLTRGIYVHHLPDLDYQRDYPVNNWNRGEFRELCAVIAGAFLECHRVRSNCAEPHPYSTSLGTISEEVDYAQRDAITSALRPAYLQFVRLFL